LAPLQAGSNPEKTEPTYEAVVLRFNGAQLLTIMILAPLLTHLHGITGAALSVVLAAIIRDVGMGLLLPSKLGLAAGVWSRRGTRRAMELAMAKLGA
jgi:hypothetical protein